MFRIKTDIRQYKCETKEKVEKLIRNWVIRPNDLIYDQDENTWEPIGEHPSFIGVFDVLAETEANTPDTVVSREPQPDNEQEEVTNIANRSDVVTDEEEDARETDIFDQGEIARTLAEKDANGTPTPPEAPEGVEAPTNDEVTMMTDKTFDMIASEAGAEISDVEDEEPEDADSVGDDDSDVTITNGQNGSMLVAESDPTIVDSPEALDAPKLGRHSLPEEFFATNEISPVDRDTVEKRDDLNRTSEVDDEWESMVEDDEDVRTTDELDPDEIKTSLDEKDASDNSHDLSEASEAVDGDGLALRDTDELERAPTPDLEEPSEELPDDEFGEDSDPTEIAAEPSEPIHIDGYAIPTPFPIGPNADDMKIGLRRTKVARSRQLKAFPDPVQKEYFVPEIRHFNRTPEPPKDYTYMLIVAFVAVFFVFVFGLSVCG